MVPSADWTVVKSTYFERLSRLVVHLRIQAGVGCTAPILPALHIKVLDIRNDGVDVLDGIRGILIEIG